MRWQEPRGRPSLAHALPVCLLLLTPRDSQSISSQHAKVSSVTIASNLYSPCQQSEGNILEFRLNEYSDRGLLLRGVLARPSALTDESCGRPSDRARRGVQDSLLGHVVTQGGKNDHLKLCRPSLKWASPLRGALPEMLATARSWPPLGRDGSLSREARVRSKRTLLSAAFSRQRVLGCSMQRRIGANQPSPDCFEAPD